MARPSEDGGVSLPSIHPHTHNTPPNHKTRRCASARVPRDVAVDTSIALQASNRRLKATHLALLASRTRVDAKYVAEVERRSLLCA